MQKNYLHQKGFTMIEVMIALAIMVLLVAIVLPKFSEMRTNQSIKNGTSDIVTALTKARSQSLSSVESSEYGVRFETDRVIIFKGTTYSSSDPDNETIDISSPTTISTITLTSGASELYFNRLTGLPSKNGTVTLTNGSLTKTVTITAGGAVSSN